MYPMAIFRKIISSTVCIMKYNVADIFIAAVIPDWVDALWCVCCINPHPRLGVCRCSLCTEATVYINYVVKIILLWVDGPWHLY